MDLMQLDELLSELHSPRLNEPPLALASANLDHIHYFRDSRSWTDLIEGSGLRWRILLDGLPLVRTSRRLTGTPWPRLAGADLLPSVLEIAESSAARVGFLGGTLQMHRLLQAQLRSKYPRLRLSGMWGPSREALTDSLASKEIARRIQRSRTDLLVVGLGKPLQERWIAQHGLLTGAKVLMAFGAAADFLAGVQQRAPRWVQDAGGEWLFRLVKDPRRMGKRYLIQGPPALWRLQTHSRAVAASIPAGDNSSRRSTAPTVPVLVPDFLVPDAPQSASHENSPTIQGPPMISGSIVMPAHNEEEVILRTLELLAPLIANGEIEVVVAANGCTDRTVTSASSIVGTTVLDLPNPSKTAALRAADRVATAWPRLYLDADVVATPQAIRAVLRVLSGSETLAARPTFRYDVSDASWVVRAFYRARNRLPETQAHLWGAGAYALTKEGRGRFSEFPDVVADDLFIDSLFTDTEIAIVPTEPVVVHTPLTVTGLLAVLRRNYRGNRELRAAAPGQPSGTTRSTLRELVLSARSPSAGVDAVVYATLVVWARVVGARKALRWERDTSSRRRSPSQL